MDTVDDLKKDIAKKDAIVKMEQQRLKSEIENIEITGNNDYFIETEMFLKQREIEKQEVEKEIIKTNNDINGKSLTTLTNDYLYKKALDKSTTKTNDSDTIKTNDNINENKQNLTNKSFLHKIKENLKKIVLGS